MQGVPLWDAGCRVGKAIRRRLQGRPWQSVQVERPCVLLGSDYGGYAVCPEGLDGDAVVYSVGLGEDISFDLAIIERFGVTVHAFDPTPRSLAWVESQNPPEQLVIHPWGLAHYDGIARFTPPENPEHISHTVIARERYAGDIIEVPVKRLASFMEQLGHDHVDILKMDIEGAEYEVVDDLIRSQIPVGQLLLEYHHHRDGIPLLRTERSLAQLNRAGFRVFHASRSGYEFSLIRL